MDLLNQMAEEKILQAISRGELDNLPGAGQPLQLEDLVELGGIYIHPLQFFRKPVQQRPNFLLGSRISCCDITTSCWFWR